LKRLGSPKKAFTNETKELVLGLFIRSGYAA